MEMWDTPYGRNSRYTIRFHVVGERLTGNQAGSMRPVDRYVEYRIVTPHDGFKAVVLAATWLQDQEPESIYRTVELVNVETDFSLEPRDYRDGDSNAL
jgi:hypothetical protein